MRKPEDSNFCYYPFMQILVTSEGKFRPCSKHLDHIKHQGKVLTTKNSSIGEAWNSDYMKEMRDQFNANKQFAGCGECWRLQRIGLKSMRYDSYQYEVADAQVADPIAPVRVELNSSNFCNLKCRICYPTASTKWINEAKKLYGWHETLHKNLEDNNLNQVQVWAENLQELCFFGGEPLLSKENLALMQYLIDSGHAQNIDLLFNTNGTIFTDEIVGLITKFKRVRMYFSIDDIGERFEYQRKNANWNEVVNNIRKAYDLSKSKEGENIHFKICNTVSIFNIYYYPEFFAFFNKEFPGLPIFWNLIFDPWEFNIQILPESAKAIITERLQNLVTATYEMTEEDTKTIENLVQYLNYSVDRPIEGFFRLVNKHDVYRAESFETVFPELWSILQEYKPEDLKMGSYDALDIKIHEMINNPDKFQHFAFVQNLRADWPFLKEKENINYSILISSAVNALKEINEQLFNKPDFNNKLAAFEKVVSSRSSSNFDLFEDYFVFGSFKFYKALIDMEVAEIERILMQKYPVYQIA